MKKTKHLALLDYWQKKRATITQVSALHSLVRRWQCPKVSSRRISYKELNGYLCAHRYDRASVAQPQGKESK